MTGPSASRAAYLAELTGLLWPTPARTVRGPGPGPGYLLVPSAADPRMVLPYGSRRAAAAAVLGFNKDRSPGTRLRSQLLAYALRCGLGRLALRDRLTVLPEPGGTTIEDALTDALGRPVVAALHVGPARANRKPVLQLLTPAGRTVGFAKLGASPLTARLVRAETAALRRLAAAELRAVRVPRVLHEGTWQGAPLLVQEALPVWRRRGALGPARLAAAMAEVARATGTRTEELAEGAAATLADGVAALPVRPERTALLAALDRLRDRAAGAKLPMGAWHGDWTRWNMAPLRDELLVWDWERFTDGVPVGFDALHHHLQDAVSTAGRDPAAAAHGLLAAAPGLLARMDVPAPARHPVTALYLIELATRYLEDRQAEAGSPLGHVDRWLLPALSRHLSGD
ncbi:MAG: hypothetical protein GEV11_01850 [Streptosporangiales bacterium]|nr:hypothetical protein [Streptosporangiales bacterium]